MAKGLHHTTNLLSWVTIIFGFILFAKTIITWRTDNGLSIFLLSTAAGLIIMLAGFILHLKAKN